MLIFKLAEYNYYAMMMAYAMSLYLELFLNDYTNFMSSALEWEGNDAYKMMHI